LHQNVRLVISKIMTALPVLGKRLNDPTTPTARNAFVKLSSVVLIMDKLNLTQTALHTVKCTGNSGTTGGVWNVVGNFPVDYRPG
jgi:hypothetical protein